MACTAAECLTAYNIDDTDCQHIIAYFGMVILTIANCIPIVHVFWYVLVIRVRLKVVDTPLPLLFFLSLSFVPLRHTPVVCRQARRVQTRDAIRIFVAGILPGAVVERSLLFQRKAQHCRTDKEPVADKPVAPSAPQPPPLFAP